MLMVWNLIRTRTVNSSKNLLCELLYLFRIMLLDFWSIPACLIVLSCLRHQLRLREYMIQGFWRCPGTIIFQKLRHRGPDWSGIHCYQDCYLAHQRLAIVDPASGDQPLYNEDKTIVVTVNGEIYNHSELRTKLKNH
ncbi:Asparagine synthase (glutamine-hydrolyzing) protein [Dioscorea alata]|uniref:Asparagine synthase (Glutamine-hydrolyzing) protein n=1 Tax=Dioscorea alata TaxID=55571 RepID=A0ACB7V1I8_DIOAL|nr:Asparagine synthase (glutamine-hydrolyzing) protein [Dioscorea alata]